MVTINKKFQKLYTTNKRYILVTGGRGSGKTFAVQDFLIRLLEQVGQGILYTRFTMTSVEKTIIPLFVAHIELISSIDKYEITKTLIRHKDTGSFILFSGIKTSSGDQTGNLKSLPNITTWVIEEGEDFNNEKSFTDIDDSIRTANVQNRVVWIQNPTHREHFIYKKFFLYSQKNEVISEDIRYFDNNGNNLPITYQKSTHKDVEHIHTTYLDNLKNLDVTKIEHWNRTLIDKPKFWANKYGGAWVDMADGAIFEHINWVSEFPKHITKFCYGMDFGFTNDPSTIVKCGVSDGELYAERLMYKYNMTTTLLHQEMKALKISPKIDIFADCADPKTIKELNLLGWQIRGAGKGKGSIMHGINKLLSYPKINIVTCEFWKAEQISYIWGVDRKTGKPTNEPTDDFNHLWDSLRYGIQGIHKSKTAGTTYK